MSEPLDSLTIRRVEETKRLAALPRTVDLPVVAPDNRVGTLVHRARPVEHPARCRHCGARYAPTTTRQVFCCRTCQRKSKTEREALQ